jgi:DNA-directed RNA polymerase specialized sigma24 family protein
LSREEQDLQVEVAMARGAAGDPWAMLAHLQRANILAGVKITFRRKWPSLPDEEIDDFIGDAVDTLYGKVSSGVRVENPIGYAFEVMRHKAYDYLDSKRETVPLDEEQDSTDPEWESDTRPERTGPALDLARSLLPRLGQESVQVVMAQIFDAVEAGSRSISTLDIASASGLSEDTVRQCRSRGFRRLERIVREEGLVPAEMIHEDYSAANKTARIDFRTADQLRSNQ